MSEIARAVQILRSGGLVAFPTETVYGLGADATNASAVKSIFAAKGRPATNPLICHVADEHVARRYAAHWPDAATLLVKKFWPGPLTLVVEKRTEIVPEATAGLNTAAIRCPDHPLALRLLREFDGPIAAPSANRSTHVSPTTADHVRKQLGDRVDLILDGGSCRVGIESTVLDLTQPTPMILRPGGITRSQIESVIGPIEIFGGKVDESMAAASPGQHDIHYSPHAPAWRFEHRQRKQVGRWCMEHSSAPATIMAVGAVEINDPLAVSLGCCHRLLEMPSDPAEYASRIYAALHEADVPGMAAIFIELPPQGGEWTAVHDRIRRATRLMTH